MTNFWFEDIYVLFNNDYITEIIPNSKYDVNRNMNIIVRLSIYVSLLYFIIYNNTNIFCIPLLVTIASIFIHKNNLLIHNKSIYDKMYVIKDKDKDINDNSLAALNNIDSNIHDSIENKREPNINNPFMNINLVDHDDKSAYSSHDNEYINGRIEELFDYNLYKNPSDIYNNHNSQNRFYTMPVTTTVNNQTEFAEWCYGSNDSLCKSGKQSDCSKKRGTAGSGAVGPG